MQRNFLKNAVLKVVEAAAAAGTSELVSDVVDTAGFEGVTFVALLGDVTDTSVLTLTVKGNTANHVSTPTPVSLGSATFTAGAADADSKILAGEVYRPVYRYVFASLTRTTANAVLGGIIAILHGPRVGSVTQDATVIAHSVNVGAHA